MVDPRLSNPLCILKSVQITEIVPTSEVIHSGNMYTYEIFEDVQVVSPKFYGLVDCSVCDETKSRWRGTCTLSVR